MSEIQNCMIWAIPAKGHFSEKAVISLALDPSQLSTSSSRNERDLKGDASGVSSGPCTYNGLWKAMDTFLSQDLCVRLGSYHCLHMPQHESLLAHFVTSAWPPHRHPSVFLAFGFEYLSVYMSHEHAKQEFRSCRRVKSLSPSRLWHPAPWGSPDAVPCNLIPKLHLTCSFRLPDDQCPHPAAVHPGLLGETWGPETWGWILRAVREHYWCSTRFPSPWLWTPFWASVNLPNTCPCTSPGLPDSTDDTVPGAEQVNIASLQHTLLLHPRAPRPRLTGEAQLLALSSNTLGTSCLLPRRMGWSCFWYGSHPAYLLPLLHSAASTSILVSPVGISSTNQTHWTPVLCQGLLLGNLN